MKEIKGLTIERRHDLRCAIERGYLDTYEENPRAWKHTFIGAFLWKWPKRTKTVAILTDMLGHQPTWEDFTDDNVADIPDEMRATGINGNSVRTMCSELKAVLNANKRHIASEDYMNLLSTKGEASQHVYLTDKEIMRFLHFKPNTDAEQYVYRNFAIELLTGARLCDAVKLTTHNCDRQTNTLSYVPDKTSGIVVTLPVDEKRELRKFLAMRTKNSLHLSNYNILVRNICKELKINTVCTVFQDGKNVTKEKWELISSHTARRSFATNLFLEGFQLEDIAMMMGHGKNIETTKRYICAERKITPRIKAYFLPDDCVQTSEEYCKAYNQAIEDTLEAMQVMGIQSTELMYIAIKGLMK